MVELTTTLSSRGQVVIPEELRSRLALETGNRFVVFGKDDTILLKRIEVPNAAEAFEKIAKWGRKFAKEKGLKPKDLERALKR